MSTPTEPTCPRCGEPLRAPFAAWWKEHGFAAARAPSTLASNLILAQAIAGDPRFADELAAIVATLSAQDAAQEAPAASCQTTTRLVSPTLTAAIDAYGLAERRYGDATADGSHASPETRGLLHELVVHEREQLVAAITASAGQAPVEPMTASSEVPSDGDAARAFAGMMADAGLEARVIRRGDPPTASSEVWREGTVVVLKVYRAGERGRREFDCWDRLAFDRNPVAEREKAELVVRRLAALPHGERLAAFDALEQGRVQP